ncbi:MAG: LysM peptidoglycan-binding domain-containing protein [Desulfobacteraceae bacterium]|jgi:LysM repeat protein
MKWKDTGERANKEASTIEEEKFDEEQFSPWQDHNGQQKPGALIKTPLLLVLLVAAIVALVAALLILVKGPSGGAVGTGQLASYDQRLKKLEDRLDKFAAIDEKVTRIWEQAKSFEKFKGRFDRTEASMSLRMDHLTMSLETIQKQLAQLRESAATPVSPAKTDAPGTRKQTQYHVVQAKDTLYSISRRYKLKVDQLLKMNQLKPGSVIQPGQKLIVAPPSN